MKKTAELFKLFSNETRLRTLMLLGRQELCVCQIMAVLGVSQPLVSRNLSLLENAGLLKERRDGKVIYYSVAGDISEPVKKILNIIRAELKDDPVMVQDLTSLMDCQDFLKKSGRCDMKSFLEFMEQQRASRVQTAG
jgi:ArsR family transcriptional regulator